MAESQKYPFKVTFKKLDQKKYELFRISKNIGQEAFQIELSEG